MSLDHVFVGSFGREKMMSDWAAHFTLVPDDRIDVEETFVRGQTVVVLRRAAGTFIRKDRRYPVNAWSVPSAWKAA